MTQAPFQSDGLRIEPGSGQTLTITRDPATGSLRFRDAVITGGVNLSQLAGFSTVAGTYVVGKSGSGAQFTTIQAALNAVPVTSNDAAPSVIMVLPGLYTENLTWTKDGVTLLGVGLVRIVPALAQPTITIQAAVASRPHTATLQNLWLENPHNGVACVYVNGGAGSDIGDAGLYFRDCNFASSGAGGYTVYADTVDYVYLDNCTTLGASSTATLYASQCALLRVTGGDQRLVQAEYDAGGVIPSVIGSSYELLGCRSVSNVLSTLTSAGSFLISGCNSVGNVTVNGNRTLTAKNSALGNLVLGGTTAATLVNSTRGTVGGAGKLNSNTSGTLAFVASAAETFAFPVERTNANYAVALDTGIATTAYVSARSAVGFTVTFAAPVTTTMRWVLTET